MAFRETPRRRAASANGNPILWVEPFLHNCTRLLEDLLQDLYFAARQLRKNFDFAATAIAIFAVDIAASTVIYAFADAALVRPLPYRDATRLVALYERDSGWKSISPLVPGLSGLGGAKPGVCLTRCVSTGPADS